MGHYCGIDLGNKRTTVCVMDKQRKGKRPYLSPPPKSRAMNHRGVAGDTRLWLGTLGAS